MKLLDTGAWIEYFKGTDKGKKIREIIGSEDVCTSIISFAEIARWIIQNDLDLSLAVQQVECNAIVIDLDRETLVESGAVYPALRKKRNKIGMIDVIIYVAAIKNNLTLMTGDRDLVGLPGVEAL